MRQGSNTRRTRRGGGNRRPNPRTQSFDSNGPDVRIRGTAFQITEKYLTLAKDASSAGDTVLAESYFQHAEHYQRIINNMAEQVQKTETRPDDNKATVSNHTAPQDQEAKKVENKNANVLTKEEETEGLHAILKVDEMPVVKETSDKPKRAPRRKKISEDDKVAEPV